MSFKWLFGSGICPVWCLDFSSIWRFRKLCSGKKYWAKVLESSLQTSMILTHVNSSCTPGNFIRFCILLSFFWAWKKQTIFATIYITPTALLTRTAFLIIYLWTWKLVGVKSHTTEVETMARGCEEDLDLFPSSRAPSFRDNLLSRNKGDRSQERSITELSNVHLPRMLLSSKLEPINNWGRWKELSNKKALCPLTPWYSLAPCHSNTPKM